MEGSSPFIRNFEGKRAIDITKSSEANHIVKRTESVSFQKLTPFLASYY